MSWFKKFIEEIWKGAQAGERIIAQYLLPIVPVAEALAPGSAPIITKAQSQIQRVFQIIHDAQMMSTALELQPGSGPMRLKAAAPVMAQELFDMIDEIGLKVKDAAGAQAATVTITSGFADFLNALEPK